MGKDRVKDKTISPLGIVQALMAGSITIAQAQQMYDGVLPIGDYKGVASILDLDLLVKQPLVDPEARHILGIIDGREEDYDLQTLGIVLGEVLATSHVASLTVPVGEVWFLNNVLTTTPANVTANWYCSLWTDRVGALGHGQAFHAAVIPASTAQLDEFSPPGPLWLLTNKQVPLRAPAGTVFTVVCTNTATPAPANVNCTFQLYGWIGKSLVD